MKNEEMKGQSLDCENCEDIYKCGETCPIWCNTKMLECSMMGDYPHAIAYGKKAVALDPNDPVYWNNLGVAYGLSNNHRLAYESFARALELRPGYPEALNGLKVASRHIGPGLGSPFANEIINQNIYTQEDAKDVMQTTAKMIPIANGMGVFPANSFPWVPELTAFMDDVPKRLIRELKEWMKSQGWSIKEHLPLAIKWGFFAGIAAVTLWDIDWPTLRKRGLLDLLYDRYECSVYDLDESVLKIAYGEQGKSEKEIDEINDAFNQICWLVYSEFDERGQCKTEKDMIKMIQVGYLLGCAYRMHELGKH